MVKLHLKKGDESQFLFETTVNIEMDSLLRDLVVIYNGRLKIQRLCAGKANIILPTQLHFSVVNSPQYEGMIKMTF